MESPGLRSGPRWGAWLGAVAVAVLAPLATACQADAVTPTPPAVTSTVAAPTTGPATPSATGPATGPAPAPTEARPISVAGVVRAGANPGCFVLRADDGGHFVLADVPHPPTGVPVLVSGTTDPEELSRCNAGTVLHARSVTIR